MAQFEMGLTFLRKLADAGVVPDNVRRVVIDANVDAAVILYVECFGDTRVLELGTDDFSNAVVVRVQDAPSEQKA